MYDHIIKGSEIDSNLNCTRSVDVANSTPTFENSIRYSRGTSKYDNAPVQLVASDFEAFERAILCDRAEQKGQQFICAPLQQGIHYDKPKEYPGKKHYRLKNYAAPRSFAPLDCDGFKDINAYSGFLMHAKRYRGFGYTTASHQESAPRARVILALNRPVSRTEGIALGNAVQSAILNELGADAVVFDDSVYKGEQPIYTPVVSSETFHFNGAVLDVDEWLEPTTIAVPPVETMAPVHVGTVTAALMGASFVLPDSVSDGEHRELILLKYAGHLRGKGLEQKTIERILLDYNQQHIKPPHPDEVVLDRARRYEEENVPVSEGTGQTRWGTLKPLPPKYPNPPKLDTSILPAVLADFVNDAANRMQVPPEMIATPLIISLGSVIGKLLAVQPMQANISWSEFPNLWGVGILPPAMLKSPALNAGVQFIQSLESEAQRKHSLEMANWESEERVRKLEIDNLQVQAKAAVKNGNRANAKALLDSIQEIKPPLRLRFIVQDATPEARLEILTENPNGCMLVRDEFDGHMAQLRREGYENARAQELQFYDGKQDYANDRIKRGSSVAESPRLAIYGNLQPSKVEKYLRELKHGGNDDGYVQRLFQLGIQPTIDAQYILTDTKPDQQAESRLKALFQAAAALPSVRDVFTGRLNPKILKFDVNAQPAFNGFLIGLENKVRSGISSSMQASHIGKYRGTLPKLALIMAFAEDPNAASIDATALDRAQSLLGFYNAHAKRIYAVETRGDIVSAHELLARIKKGAIPDGFNPRDDVMRKEWDGLTKSAEVEGALSVLVKHGYLTDTELPTAGRARRTVFIHPDVLADVRGRK